MSFKLFILYQNVMFISSPMVRGKGPSYSHTMLSLKISLTCRIDIRIQSESITKRVALPICGVI